MGDENRPVTSSSAWTNQYASYETTSPLLRVTDGRRIMKFRLSLTNRTEPSPSSAFTPPGWKPKISMSIWIGPAAIESI
jgi:hypothetical protein